MRFLFHAVNGTGLGHLRRARLIADGLAARDFGFEGLVCTNAVDGSLLEGSGLDVLRLPYTTIDEVRAGDDPTPREVNLRAFLAAARAFEPDVALFDTHVPKPVLRDRSLDGCARALILRTVKPRAARKLFVDGIAGWFDRILIPADVGAPPLPAIALQPPLAPRIRQTGPVLCGLPDESACRAVAERYRLAPGQPLVLCTLGGGGPQLAPGKRALTEDAAQFARAAAEALRSLATAFPAARFLVQVGPYGPALESGGGVEVVRYEPGLAALVHRADVVVALAGYNAVWEIVQARAAAVLLCKRSRQESQQTRAAALLARGAVAEVIEKPEPSAIESAVRRLLGDADARGQLRAALGEIPIGDGVADTVDALLDLAGAPIPRLPAPPACEDPCADCPVETGNGAWRPAVESLFRAGARRVVVPCSTGLAPDLCERLAAIREAGLTPLLETTGRMAMDSASVRDAIADGASVRLLLFGLGKKMHDKASGRSGSLAATRDLARALPPQTSPAQWRLLTRRLGKRRDDPVLPIDRRAFLDAGKDSAEKLPAVAVLRRRWLPYSEVFVHEEARSYARHRPLVVCKETEGDRWPGLPVLPLGDTPPDRAARILRPAGVTVAHAVFATCASSFLGLVDALDVPLVVSARGHDVYREDRSHLPPVFAAAARVLARTSEMAVDLVAMGCPREKVQVLPTGIDLDRFGYRAPRSPSSGRVCVISVGRFTPKKGIPDVLRAFSVLAEREADATLEIFGLGHLDEDPTIVAEARSLCEQPPLRGRVRLREAVPQAQLADALARADLYLCAPRVAPDGDREGLPNALKEAMAVGLPVVATRHGAIAGLLEGEGEPTRGTLAAEGDWEALGEALHELARSPDRWPDLALRGRQRVAARFDRRQVVAALEALYESLSASG